MKNLLRLFLLIFLYILFPNKILAQFIKDIAGVAVTIHAESKFNNVPSGSSLIGTKFKYNSYDACLPLPPLHFGKTLIFSNINYRLMDFSFDKETTPNPYHIDKIHELKAVVIIRHPISTKWSLLGVIIPTVASDFKNSFSGDDLMLDGIYGVSKKFGKHANLEIGLGVHAMYSFHELLITPGVSIDYKSNNGKWIGQFYWPRLNVVYNLSKNTQVGIAGSIDWTKYNLKSYTDFQGKEINYAQFSTIHAGLQFNQRIYNNFWIQVQGGMGLFNSYKLFNSNHDTIRNFSIDNMAYGKVMLTYRIK
ncbi:hypothetical protein CLV51_103114 [Chitinophaga niastensis]|uniref:DUF6268 domain-containing protein n=1 Tax=Chitinophaga niastensis TaxID=536980 RepID=A0A2P8HIU2_CHINA|nr:DUF6268 family outer membrane beta-barrel protein [Chitinophaga niastensis]PSL46138.1 hypothetical protein CLV51_103114 [Chitinophaga niastensis]